MSSDFGGAVRFGAVVGADDGATDGDGDTIGTTICVVVVGATQSSGCTMVSPVRES